MKLNENVVYHRKDKISFQTTEAEENSNSGDNPTDVSYKHLLAQQDELQKDLKKLANLINSTKSKPSKTTQLPGYPPFSNPELNYGAQLELSSLPTGKSGKGCGLVAYSTEFIQPSSDNVSNNDRQCKRYPTAKYIRIQADSESGEPLISIFDETGQSQAVCAYLTKDFKLDIDCKLWNKPLDPPSCSDQCLSRVGQGQQCPSPSPRLCTPNNSITPCPATKTECCPTECSPPFGNWFIWRIDNFACVEERNSGDWCDPFYLGQPGYRMQAKLEFTSYLFGIYIKMYVGDYDGCLTWPFDSDIYFSILDQTGLGNHVVRVLRPYLNDCDECGVWDRPTCEKQICQIGWGIPDMGLRSMVHSKMCKPSPYLRNGTMYIQITLGKSISCLGT